MNPYSLTKRTPEEKAAQRKAAQEKRDEIEKPMKAAKEARKRFLNGARNVAIHSAHGVVRSNTRSFHGRRWDKPREDARIAQRERTLILANGPEFPQEEWLERVREWGDKCLRCGDTYDLTVDHIIPVSLGGTHHIENLQLLCRSCNSSKGTKKDDYRPPKI